jgi:hypothetical protein
LPHGKWQRTESERRCARSLAGLFHLDQRDVRERCGLEGVLNVPMLPPVGCRHWSWLGVECSEEGTRMLGA